MTKRNGPGRPPLPRVKRKRNPVTVYLDDKELRAIQRASGDSRLTHWARRVLLDAAGHEA